MWEKNDTKVILKICVKLFGFKDEISELFMITLIFDFFFLDLFAQFKQREIQIKLYINQIIILSMHFDSLEGT